MNAKVLARYNEAWRPGTTSHRTRARFCDMASTTAFRPSTSGRESVLKPRLEILKEKLSGSTRSLLESDENVARWHANWWGPR